MKPALIKPLIRVCYCLALLALVLGGSGAAEVSTGADDFGLVTGGFTEVLDFAVSLEDHSIGAVTEYRLDFSIVSTRFSQLPGGGFVVTFPQGFLLDSASLIDFSHSDYKRTFVVESLDRSGGSLTVHLTSLLTSLGISTEEVDGIDTVSFSIVLGDIGNPAAPGSRRLGLVVFDRSDRIMAPIAYSNLFEIEGIQTQGVQLTEVSVIAPNQPNVNTGQPFQIRCLLVNLSEHYSGPFRISMISDGNSQYAPDLPVGSIPCGDSIEIHFDVTASLAPSPAEVFVVGLHSGDVVWESPLDDNAAVVIQTPASLVLNRTPEKDTIYVTHASSFVMGLTLVNEGQAAAGAGLFRLVGGSLFGVLDPLIDTIKAGEPYIL
ncbi:MAG: hypothetical protein JSU65_10540, partial [Candidatus Zixiibacteriota bacterium]